MFTEVPLNKLTKFQSPNTRANTNTYSQLQYLPIHIALAFVIFMIPHTLNEGEGGLILI